MNRFIALVKTLYKNGSDSTVKKKKIIYTVILLLCFAPLMVTITMGLAQAYDSLAAVGQQGVVVGLAVSFVCAFVFFFGIFYILNYFYMGKDIENLLPLPLNPFEILGAKFSVVLIYEYITEAVIFLPIVIMYGIKSGSGILYYLYILVIFLTLPIIPLVLAAIIDMVIMRFTNVGKHKELLKIVGGLFAIFIGIFINIVMQRSSNGNTNPFMAMAQGGSDNGALAMASKVFPTSKLAILALVNSNKLIGFGSLLLFLIITLTVLGVFLILGQSLYLKGVVGLSESSSKRKKLTGEELDKTISESSVLKSYTLKELKLLFRTSVYFLNCVMMNFLWPIFILLPIFASSGSEKIGNQEFQRVAQFLKDPKISAIIFVGIFAFILFLSSSNVITSTSISREGENIYFNKYIPVDYKTQIMAKVMSGVILTSVSILLLVIIGLVFLKIISMLSVAYIVILDVVVGMLGILFASFTGIFIDLNFPKLHWDNEQKAVKQNFNGMINMLICIAIGGLVVFLIVKLELTLWVSFTLILVVFSILDILLYYLLSTKGVELLSKIEA